MFVPVENDSIRTKTFTEKYLFQSPHSNILTIETYIFQRIQCAFNMLNCSSSVFFVGLYYPLNSDRHKNLFLF